MELALKRRPDVVYTTGSGGEFGPTNFWGRIVDRRIVFFTDRDFWREGTGGRVRTLSILRYLESWADVVVVAKWRHNGGDKALVNRLKLKNSVVWIDELSSAGGKGDFVRVLLGFQPAVVLFRSDNAGSYREVVPENITTIVDVDDLPSELYESKLSYGSSVGPHCEPRTLADDIAEFNAFDYVAFIQNEHFVKCKGLLSSNKIFVLPHAISVFRTTLRSDVRTIGLVSSGWQPNIDGFNWFRDEVWPLVGSESLHCDIYGLINGVIEVPDNIRLFKKGFAANLDSTYRVLDMAINPVLYGSGVKIKTLESLAYGIPSVVTSEGARGLRELNNSALLVRDSPYDFADGIMELQRNYSLRIKMAEAAREYIKSYHSPLVCYAPLKEIILSC